MRKKVRIFFRHRLKKMGLGLGKRRALRLRALLIVGLLVLTGLLIWGTIRTIRTISIAAVVTGTGKDKEAGVVRGSFEEAIFQWHRLYEVDTFGQILASPLIGEMDSVRGGDILVVNALGAVYVLNGISGEAIYRFGLEGRVVASPFFITLGVDKQGEKVYEPFVLDENGVFYVLAVRTGTGSGDYLYRSREELPFANKILATPAYGILGDEAEGVRGSIFVGGSDGIVAAYESLYGRLIWSNDNIFASGEEIFAAPLLMLGGRQSAPHRDRVVFAGTQGRVVILDARSGEPLSRLQFKGLRAKTGGAADGIRSGMSALEVVSSSPGLEVAALTYEGGGYVFSMDGEIFCTFDLMGNFISSVTKGHFYTGKEGLDLLAVAVDGRFYTVALAVGPDGKLVCSAQLLARYRGADFIASPLVADFNDDNVDDILIASRQGELFLINGKDGSHLVTPFALGYAVTATPAVGDLTGDGHLEVIVAGENGTVTVVSLLNAGQGLATPYEIVSGTFLKDTYNHN